MTRLMILAILATVVGLYFFPMLAMAQTGASQNESRNAEDRKFRADLDEDWKRWMENYPVMASFFGYPGQSQRWSHESPRGIEAPVEQWHESLAPLTTNARA